MVFSRSWWIDSVEASSHHQHCKQLCDGMEIPCWVTFTCSRKAMLNWLKALLKVVIYANLRHGVQMFSQISRIPHLIRTFWAKKCGLYAGVYGNHLCSTSVRGNDLSNDAQIRVIGLMEPEICTKMLKKSSEKFRAKFPATTHGYSIVKLAPLIEAFLEVF